jgi:opacity protein-like surface antigen
VGPEDERISGGCRKDGRVGAQRVRERRNIMRALATRNGRSRHWPARGVSALIAAGLLILWGSAVAGGFSPEWNERRGFSLGLQFQTNIIGAEDPSPDSDPNAIFVDEVGFGGTLLIGYTFTPKVALRLSLGSAVHGTTRPGVEMTHSAAVLEAHYRFLPEERARPYVVLGLGGTSLMSTSEGVESETSGGMASVGVGLLYALTKHLLLDFTARLESINWKEQKVRTRLPGGEWVEVTDPVDDTGSSGRFLLGLVWRF